MSAETAVPYHEYIITITEEAGRFTARVTRPGGLIEHDGRASEVWSAASSSSHERALTIARTAIDTDRIR